MSALVPVRDLDQFRASPVGRLYVGLTFVLWCAAPDLVGAIQWDAIDDDTARVTETVLDFVCRTERAAVLDWKDVERVDGETLVGIAARMRRVGLSEGHVVVLPAGLPRVLLAGLALSLAPSPPQFADTREEAIAAVGHELAAAAASAALDHAAEVRSGPAILVRLREMLRRNLASATVVTCGEELGVSARSLQRILEHEHTTFTLELRRARMVAAVEMLECTDLRLEIVATRSGFGTPSRLSDNLRRELHVTPREVRARRA